MNINKISSLIFAGLISLNAFCCERPNDRIRASNYAFAYAAAPEKTIPAEKILTSESLFRESLFDSLNASPFKKDSLFSKTEELLNFLKNDFNQTATSEKSFSVANTENLIIKTTITPPPLFKPSDFGISHFMKYITEIACGGIAVEEETFSPYAWSWPRETPKAVSEFKFELPKAVSSDSLILATGDGWSLKKRILRKSKYKTAIFYDAGLSTK